MRQQAHKDRCAHFLRDIIGRFLPQRIAMNLVIDDEAEVDFVRRSVKPLGRQHARLVVVGGIAHADTSLAQALAAAIRPTIASELDIVAFMLSLVKVDRLIWSMRQVVFWLALAIENNYDALSHCTDVPVCRLGTHIKRKRRDPHMLECLVKQHKRARVERGASSADAQVFADMAKQRASLPEGEERDFVRKECYRYVQACKKMASQSFDMSISFDGVRACKKDWLLVAVYDPRSDTAAWCPPQEPPSGVRLCNSVISFL